MGELSPWHLLIIAAVVVLLFGSRKLPEAARSLGRSLRIFRSEVKAMHDDDAPALPPGQPAAAPPAAPPYQQVPAATPYQQAPAAAPYQQAPTAPAVQEPATTPGGAPPAVPPAPQYPPGSEPDTPR